MADKGKFLGRYKVFEEEGAKSARRVYVQDVGGWVSRMAVRRNISPEFSESQVRGFLGEATFGRNAQEYAKMMHVPKEQVLLNPEFLAMQVEMSEARAAGDWARLGELIRDMGYEGAWTYDEEYIA